jgi:hypothetical protein
MRSWLRQALRRATPDRLAEPRPDVNPFSALEIQLSLARLERELLQLDQCDDRKFGRAHHYYAALGAYDQLLAEACGLAGIAASPRPGDPAWRMVADVELRVRGWTW